MNEKRFFHNALESDLLSGRVQKRRLDAALGRTRAASATAAPMRTNVQKESALKRWIYIPAVAVLLVLTVAIGSVVIVRGFRNEQHQAGQPIADQTPVEIPRPIILSNNTEVRLLSEIDTEGLFEQARANDLHIPAYIEADWEWLRKARASVNDLSATASTIRWTTELRVSKDDHAENPFETLVDVTRGMPLCFFYAGSGLDTPDVGAELTEFASPGEIRFGDDGYDWIVLIPEVCAMPQVYDQFPAALPPTGEVTIRNTMQILDRAGEAGEFTVQVTKEDGTTDEVSAALLGTVEHTFTFDAEVVLNIAEPAHIDVPLSGEYILSIHENNGFHNERVDLSGVTLDAEIHYTVEGVVVILSIKDAGALSDVEQESLYLALSGGPDGTGDLPWAYARETDSSYRVYPLSRTFWGTTRFARYLIAIDPSEYASAKGVNFLGNVSYAVGAANDEPREDWSWFGADGALPSLLMDCRQLPTLSIPLPEVSASMPTACPPTEGPTLVPMLDEATLCTTWTLAELEAPDGSSGDARALGLERYLVFRSDGTVRIIDTKAPSEQVVPYTQNGNTVRFDGRVLRYDSEYNELVEIDSSSQDILFYAPTPNAGVKAPDPAAPQDDKVAICVYFYDGDAEDAINEQFKAQYPELYNAHRDPDHATDEQVQQAIEARRQVAAAYYSEKNRERCLKLCDEEDILFLSNYSAMCIIRVPYEKFSEIRSTPGVTHIEIYEEMSSYSDPDPVTWSAALSELLGTEAPETVLNIQFWFDYGSALEDAFLYDGKTLTEYRNQPALRAYSNEYEGWYFNEYRKLDAQNRDTPGWEKHSPGELFDAYWREQHTEEEIRAYEQAFAARKKALNAFSEWRDGEGGQETLRKILQQECDRLNALGFSLRVTEDRQIEGTATVKQLLDFPSKEGYHYWISLIGDDSPIDE